jgi:hypothetical protein
MVLMQKFFLFHQVNVKMIPVTLCNGSLPLPELWQLNSCVQAVVSRLRAAAASFLAKPHVVLQYPTLIQ